MVNANSFAVSVPGWSSLRFLKDTLPHLVNQAAGVRAEILVVDNGSTDDTFSYVRTHFPSVRIERIDRTSIGAARNYGVRRTDGSILCFIDADCVVERGYFERALADFQSEGISVTGNSYVLPPEPHWIEAAWDRLHRRTASGPTRLLPAGNFLVRRSVFDEVCGFDESLITGEDAELCQRLIGADHHPFADQELRVQHLGNPKTLSGFYRRNVWHSLGMFGTGGTPVLSRPTLMLIAHLLLTLTGAVCLVLLLSDAPLTGLAILFASQSIVPLLTVAYRFSVRGGGVTRSTILVDLFSAVFLYWLYYWARASALRLVILGRGRDYSK